MPCDLSCSCTARRTSSGIVENTGPLSPFFPARRAKGDEVAGQGLASSLALAGKQKHPQHTLASFFSCILNHPFSTKDDRHSLARRSYLRFQHIVVIVTSSASSFFWDPAFLNNFINNSRFRSPEDQLSNYQLHHAYLCSRRSAWCRLCYCRHCSEESSPIRHRQGQW